MIIIANLKKSIRVKASRPLVINGKHLLASYGKEKEIKNVGGKKEKKKKTRAFATPRLELSLFTLSQLSNTVYQRIVELT